MSSSDDDDGDYVPEADEEEEDAVIEAEDTVDKQRSVTTDSHLDKLWDDLNASTAVSKTAADKTATLLSGLTKKTKRSADKKKKRKLREFSIPILSVDVKKSRKDLAEFARSKQKVERVVKFAGQEYSVATSAGTAKSGKKGLDKVLESLDEPKKVSTMEKSSLDWDKFKEKEGIEDELTHYTKDGYIEKQEFLQRLDLKRFEIEKAERDKQRKLQQQQRNREIARNNHQ
ncbi:SWR1-complex protein 5/Craniofacial development protein [Phytophthora cactorum]|nr:SWR1-complex protein 5/Craniofacial development protein [Phytophthora cactorum]